MSATAVQARAVAPRVWALSPAGGVTALAALLLLAVPLLFVGQGRAFLDPDEGLYGAIAREMLDGGDWVLPRFNGLPYLEKPPLYFWLSAAALALGASAEWATRGVSAVAALGGVLLTWRMGRRLHGPAAGLLAGIALASMAGSVLYVRKASTDFLLVFCVTLALYGFLRDAERREAGAWRFLLAYAGIGLGLLTKGLIGALFPAVIIALTVLVVKRPRFSELNVARGVLVVLAIALPWHVAAAWQTPRLFWFYLVDNQLLRFLNLRGFLEDDVPVSAGAFLVISFLLAFPWSVFVLGRAAAGAQAWMAPLTWIWLAVIVGFFATSSSTLEYYALPAFPAVAMRAGAALAARRDVAVWMAAGLIGCALIGGAALWIGSGLTARQAFDGLAELNVYYRILRDQGRPLPFPSPGPFGLLLQALGLTLLVGWTAAALAWRLGRVRASIGALLAVAVAVAVLIVKLLDVIEPHHSAREVADVIRTEARASDVVVHEGSLEYSAALPLYAGRRILVVNGRRGDLEFASRLPEARGMFLEASDLRALWDGERRVFLVTREPSGVGVVQALPRERLRDLGEHGSRRLYSNR
jgi:hypothetical protein